MVNTKVRLIMIFASEGGETLYSQLKKKKKRLGADCGSDHKVLIKIHFRVIQNHPLI